MTRLRSCSKSASEVGTGSRTADSTAAHAQHEATPLPRCAGPSPGGAELGEPPEGQHSSVRGCPAGNSPAMLPVKDPHSEGLLWGLSCLGLPCSLLCTHGP